MVAFHKLIGLLILAALMVIGTEALRRHAPKRLVCLSRFIRLT